MPTMDQSAPSSFIPKRPLGIAEHSDGGVASLALLVALLLFIPSILAAGGVLAYQQFLTNAIAQKSDSLAKAEAAFDPSTIQDLERLDARIKSAEGLLKSHVAPTALFDFLSAQTLTSVQLTSFDYSLNQDGSADISVKGQGNSFASVALQSDQFGASKVLKDLVFSDVTVGQAGGVSFSVKATVDASLFNYANGLTSSPAASNTATSPNTPAVAPSAPATVTPASSTTPPTTNSQFKP